MWIYQYDRKRKNGRIVMITAKIKDKIIGFAQLQIHKDIFEEYNPYITVWSVRIKKI